MGLTKSKFPEIIVTKNFEVENGLSIVKLLDLLIT
jgi:hypothetical protein